MDIPLFVFAWLIGGICVSFIQHASDRAVYPFDRDTIGQMILWPLFVSKWTFMGLAWLVNNVGVSLSNSYKQLRG